jgi:hypothetical protein
MKERLLPPLDLRLGGELVRHPAPHLRTNEQPIHHDKRDERSDGPLRAPSALQAQRDERVVQLAEVQGNTRALHASLQLQQRRPPSQQIR